MAFIEEVIEDIEKARELNDGEKDELVKMVEKAWLSEVCPNYCPGMSTHLDRGHRRPKN